MSALDYFIHLAALEYFAHLCPLHQEYLLGISNQNLHLCNITDLLSPWPAHGTPDSHSDSRWTACSMSEDPLCKLLTLLARSGEKTLWDSRVSELEHGDAVMEVNSFRKPEVENLNKEVTGRFSCVRTCKASYRHLRRTRTNWTGTNQTNLHVQMPQFKTGSGSKINELPIFAILDNLDLFISN